jgi:hypothetical protein
MDRRCSVRRKTYKGARIAFDGRRAAISCIVRNISAGGACLAVDSPVGIPATFSLEFDSGELSRPCRVVWCKESRMGVAFQ